IGIATDLRNDGLLAIEHVPEQPPRAASAGPPGSAGVIVTLLGAKVRSGAKSSTFTGQYRDTNIIVGVDVIPDSLEFGMRRPAHSILPSRIVDCNGGYAVCSRYPDPTVVVRVDRGHVTLRLRGC